MNNTDMDFIETSVEDMESSIRCAEVNGNRIFNSATLQEAFEITSKRGEKTKARIIQRYIKKAIKRERYGLS